MTKDELLQIKEHLTAAHQMVSDLCQGNRRWTMSVPARFGYDPDLVIDHALVDADKMLIQLLSDAEQRNAPTEAGGEWTCTKCKTRNSDDKSICGFCDTPRLGG